MTDMTPLAPGVPTGRPERIAVVGAGISGLTAAYVLGRPPRGHRAGVGAAARRPRPHAHRRPPPDGDLRVDSGFIVHNDRTYPLLRRLFAELGVQARATEMSMSIRDDSTGTEYAGGRGVKGFVARPRQLLDREFVGMLRSVRRFHALATAFLEQTTDDDTTTYGEFIRDGGFPESFTRLYAVPAGRLRVVERPAARRWTTPRATCSASSSTTACSPSATPPSG